MPSEIERARELLSRSGQFCYDHWDKKDEDDDPRDWQTLLQSDVWGWATVFGQYVEDDELPEVADLYERYGTCGVYYWVSEKHDEMESEFYDINRMVEFVRKEEEIRRKIPDSNKRAYHPALYVLGCGDAQKQADRLREIKEREPKGERDHED